MISNSSVPKNKRIINLVLAIITAVFYFCNFIVEVVYFQRMNPWYSRSSSQGKLVFYTILIGWLTALLYLVDIVCCVIFTQFFIKENDDSCIAKSYPTLEKLLYTLSHLNVLASVLPTVISILPSDGILCAKFIRDVFKGINTWLLKNNYRDYEKFNNWFSKLTDDKICKPVLIPILVFSILGYIFSIVTLCTKNIYIAKANNNSASENQNDEN